MCILKIIFENNFISGDLLRIHKHKIFKTYSSLCIYPLNLFSSCTNNSQKAYNTADAVWRCKLLSLKKTNYDDVFANTYIAKADDFCFISTHTPLFPLHYIVLAFTVECAWFFLLIDGRMLCVALIGKFAFIGLHVIANSN